MTIPRRKCTQKELLSLLDKLNFAARVVPPGWTFKRRLFDRAYSVRAAHHLVDISADCRRDSQWWRWLLTNWNGCSFFFQGQWTAAPDLHLFTDAARSHGFGAVYGPHWLTGEWLPAQQNCCITWMELYPIVLACATWALGAPPNPLPLRQPGRPGRGPIRHVSLQKCHVFTPITFLPDCYVFMRGRCRVHSRSVKRGC